MLRASLVASVALLAVGAVAAVAGLPLVLVAPVVVAVVAGLALGSIPTSDDTEGATERRRPVSAALDLEDHPAVERTGGHVAGSPVYETDVDGRPVTAVATSTGDGRAVVVRTPLAVTRRGVGFALRGGDGLTVEREPTAVQSGDASDLLDGVRATLSGVSVGRLRVDDRLGLVEHRLDDLSTGEQFRRQGAALVAVAGAVEQAADADPDAGTERRAVRTARTEDGHEHDSGG